MDDEPQNVGEVLLELFDETHDTIHMLRHLSGDFLQKADFLEHALVKVIRLEMVDPSKLAGGEPLPDNVIQFPNAFLRELDEE
jgi:hypothetical protein|tara:strand:+ start:470 stop:718 length:249 start_codon:yes stop_codon:yes gene_type:complete